MLLVAVAALAASGGGVALGAGLGVVTAQDLTAYSAASTVPASSCSSGDDVDTWIDGQNPTTKHGGSATLRVNAQRPADALLQFTPCAPANAAIVGATLSLTVDTAPNKARVHDLYDITGLWTKNTTWSTQPAIAATSTASATTAGAGGVTSWDVTTDVQSFVDGATNDGWEIQDDGTGNGNTLYDSDSSSTPPSLAITYYP